MAGSIRIAGENKASTLNSLQNETGYGAYYLANNPDLFEPQRTNNFEFIVTDLNGIALPGAVNASYGTFADAQDMLRLSVASGFEPHFGQSSIEIKRGNTTIKVAGTPSFDSGQIKIRDFIGARTKEILMAWQNLSFNVATEKVGLAGDYKKNAYLIEQTPDGQTVRTWAIYGCWISKLSGGDFNHDNNGASEITATIEYDYGKIDYSGMNLLG